MVRGEIRNLIVLARQLDRSFPGHGRLRSHLQALTGCGETMVDHDQSQTTVCVGPLRTDWM